MSKRWYVVQTKPTQEQTAAINLRSKKFTVFSPMYIHEYRSPKTKELLSRRLPLFPSYIFVQFDITRHKRWKGINGIRGVVGLVGCTEDYLSPVKEGCIEDIIARADEKGFIKLEEAVEQLFEFSPNMKLELKGENYQGLIGTYVSHSEKRVTLLLTLLNRNIRVILPIGAVRPAKTDNQLSGGGSHLKSNKTIKRENDNIICCHCEDYQ